MVHNKLEWQIRLRLFAEAVVKAKISEPSVVQELHRNKSKIFDTLGMIYPNNFYFNDHTSGRFALDFTVHS